LTARFALVFDPDQLEHRVCEEEAPVGRALPGVAIRAALDETEVDQALRFRPADGRAYEDVIDLDREAGHAAKFSR
jgi:hypothetical protein